MQGEVTGGRGRGNPRRRLVRVFAVGLGVAVLVPVWRHFRHASPALGSVAGARGKIVLTFDTEADCNYAVEKLDVLKRYGVRATFFITGQWADNWPALARRLVQDGHEVAGNHSFSHPQMGKMPAWHIWREMSMADRSIARAVGTRPIYFRPPYGEYDRRVRWIGDRFGYKTILWTTDPRDWSNPGVQRIVDVVLGEAAPGNIVLFHLSAPQTAEALPKVIEGLRARGYELVTLTEALASAQ